MTDKLDVPEIEIAGQPRGVPILGAKKSEAPLLVALATVVPGGAGMGVPAMFFGTWSNAIRNPQVLPIIQVSGPNVHHARNGACQQAMATPAKYLLFIDSDEVWDPAEMWEFIERADEAKRDVTTGVVQKLTQVSAGEYYTHPSIYDDSLRPITAPEDGGVTEVPNVGAGALLISKRLLVNMRGNWFTPEGSLGEDLSFSKHCRDMGVKMYADWDWKLGHIKQLLI